jgi:hypothetical protein
MAARLDGTEEDGMHYLWLVVALLVLGLAVPTGAQDEMSSAEDVSAEDSAPPTEGEPLAPSEPQPTTLPVASPLPTATMQPSGPGTVLLADNFDDVSRPNFPLAPVGQNRSQGYVDGQYELINGDVGGNPVPAILPGTYANSSIAIDVRVFGGPESRGGYVTCRQRLDAGAGIDEGYRLLLRPGSGELLLQRFNPSGVVTLLTQPSTAIRRGDAVNRIELTCSGPSISATINGTPVASVQDTTYTSGQHRFGVIGAGATGRFDNLLVTQQ